MSRKKEDDKKRKSVTIKIIGPNFPKRNFFLYFSIEFNMNIRKKEENRKEKALFLLKLSLHAILNFPKRKCSFTSLSNLIRIWFKKEEEKNKKRKLLQSDSQFSCFPFTSPRNLTRIYERRERIREKSVIKIIDPQFSQTKALPPHRIW